MELEDFKVALLKHPPGGLLAVNAQIGRGLRLIPPNRLDALLKDSAKLFALAQEANKMLSKNLSKDA